MRAKTSDFSQLKKEFFKLYHLADILLVSVLFSSGLLLMDFYGFPTWVYCNQSKFVTGIEIVLVIVGLVYILQPYCSIKLLRYEAISPADLIMLIAFTSFTGYLCGRYCFLITLSDKSYFMLVELVLLCVVFARVRNLCHFIKRRYNNDCSLINLEDLYYNNLSDSIGLPIQISEKATDFDLFGREVSIDQLYSSIVRCNPDESFVIGVEGDWGSGKSTILNIVKKHLIEENSSIRIIDNFDPWEYGNQESLLRSFCEILIKEMGLTLSSYESQKIINSIITACAEAVAESYHIGSFVRSSYAHISPFKSSIDKLKCRICSYLQNSSKKFVIMIDNLDRASDENIMLLFKMINTIFDFPGVIYVLAYDRGRIDKIFENTHEFNSKFIEKIIQQEIKVPELGTEQKQTVYETCVHNLLSAYGINTTEYPDMDVLLEYVLMRTENIRMFIRMLNSVFPILNAEHFGLNKFDLLGIELIHFYEPHLYQAIKQKSDYFVSNGTPGSLAPLFGLDTEEMNTEIISYYKGIFIDESMLSDLLCTLFPSVREYKRSQKVNIGQYRENIEIKKNLRIYDVDASKLYFSLTSSKFTIFKDMAIKMIERINSSEAIDELQKAFDEYSSGRTYHEISEQTGVLIIYLDQLLPARCYELAIAFFEYIRREDTIHKINLVTEFSNPIRVLAQLLVSCKIDEINAFYDRIENPAQYIDLFYLLSQYCVPLRKKQKLDQKSALKLIRKEYDKLCEKILQSNIDIFNNKYYRVHNSRYFHMYCTQNGGVDNFKEYISKIVKPQNVYRILWEMAEADTDMKHSHYDYYLRENYWNQYVDEPQRFQDCIEENKPSNVDQEFIQSLFNNYIKDLQEDALAPTKIRSISEKFLHL